MSPEPITQMLSRVSEGDESAAQELLPIVYNQLRELANRAFRKERAAHTLQPTAVVHEAYLRLFQNRTEVENRVHFFALAAKAMRQLLADHARRRRAEKRGNHLHRVTLSVSNRADQGSDQPDLMALDEALSKLSALNSRHAQIVEQRFFGGLSVKEIAQCLGVSRRTIELDWRLARAWLRQELAE